MLLEVLGQYQLELSSMQLIQNGGWAAYAAIRTVAQSREAQRSILSYQRVADDAVFVSEAAAIAGARRAAMELISREVRARPRIAPPVRPAAGRLQHTPPGFAHRR